MDTVLKSIFTLYANYWLFTQLSQGTEIHGEMHTYQYFDLYTPCSFNHSSDFSFPVRLIETNYLLAEYSFHPSNLQMVYIYSYIRKLKDRRKEPDWQLLIQTFMHPQVMKHVNVLP